MFEFLPVSAPVSSPLWLTVLLFLLYKVWTWTQKYIRWRADYNAIPGRKISHWLWGNIHEHPGPSEEGVKFQLEMMRLFPKLHTVWVSHFRCLIIVHHPATVRDLLRTSAFLAPKARGPGAVYEIGIKWLGEGLLIANGNKWSRSRRLLTPAFHFDILKSYVDVANRCTCVLVDKIAKFAEKGESFEVFHQIGLCSLDIILQCAFSYKTDCQHTGEQHPYVQAVHELSDLWVRRSLKPFMYLDFIYFNFTKDGRRFLRLCKRVHDIADEIIKRQRTILEEGKQDLHDKRKKNLDFLDIILTAKDDNGNGLTDLEIRNEVDTFLFEGHDTTTSGISFILYSLAEHQDIQDRCRQEVDSVLGNRQDITWKDMAEFPYLTQCIKEGLRLHTPVFFIQRQVTEDITIDGYKIPAFTSVSVNIHNLHHNVEVWGEDHEEFKPERFSPDNVAKMDPFAFLPFSAGPRNCIGQNFAMNEIKVMVAKLLQRFKFTLAPGQQVKKRMFVVMRTENGVFLNAEPRY